MPIKWQIIMFIINFSRKIFKKLKFLNEKKILFLCNHASFFISHRLNIYLEAKKENMIFY